MIKSPKKQIAIIKNPNEYIISEKKLLKLKFLLEKSDLPSILTWDKDEGIEQILVAPGSFTQREYIVLDRAQDATLGEGAQGKVIRGQKIIFENRQVSMQWVAIKIQHESTMTFDEDLRRERGNLALYQDRLIATANLMNENGTTIAYTVMNYCHGQNLLDFLYQKNEEISKEEWGYYQAKKPVPAVGKIKLCRLTILQIIELHCSRLAHRDIKLENLVLDTRGFNDHWRNIVLVDLGSAVLVDQEQNKEYVGTFGYTSPEVGNACYHFNQDYFSLGIVLAEILTTYNYQQGLREDLDKQKQTNIKKELSQEEIRALMPDVLDPHCLDYLNHNPQEYRVDSEKNYTAIDLELMQAAALYQILVPFIQRLVFADYDKRTHLEELKQIEADLMRLEVALMVPAPSDIDSRAERLAKFRLHRQSSCVEHLPPRTYLEDTEPEVRKSTYIGSPQRRNIQSGILTLFDITTHSPANEEADDKKEREANKNKKGAINKIKNRFVRNKKR